MLKEWFCMAHGRFENDEAICPFGCTTVERRFYTAPGMKGHGTKFIDGVFMDFANERGYTDMSNRNGTIGNSRNNNTPPPNMMPHWGKTEKTIEATLAAAGNGGIGAGEGEIPKLAKPAVSVMGAYGNADMVKEAIK